MSQPQKVLYPDRFDIATALLYFESYETSRIWDEYRSWVALALEKYRAQMNLVGIATSKKHTLTELNAMSQAEERLMREEDNCWQQAMMRRFILIMRDNYDEVLGQTYVRKGS